MTAEEFLEMQATYGSIHGITQPSEKVVLYNVALAALQLKEYEVITDKERKGWVCPVCGRAYASSVSECTECNKNREST
jgi:hypothetical protein